MEVNNVTTDDLEILHDDIKRLREKNKVLEKELKAVKKMTDKYYSLASCKYVLRNGRELTAYQLLLTLLDRWDREECAVKERLDGKVGRK